MGVEDAYDEGHYEEAAPLEVAWGAPSCSSPLAQMAATQGLTASLLAERQSESQLGLSGTGGDGGSSVRGVQLVMRNRQKFLAQPETKWHELNARVQEELHWRPGMLWSLDDLMHRWPWGYQRMLKRIGFMLARLHAELNTEAPNLGLIRGLVAQFVKVITQAALGHGAVDMAMSFWPEADPVRPSVRDPIPPPLEQADPFAGLVSAEELSAGMAYLKDSANLARARGDRVNRRHGNRETASGPGGNASSSHSGGGGGWATGSLGARSSGGAPGAGGSPSTAPKEGGGRSQKKKEAAAAARGPWGPGRASRRRMCPREARHHVPQGCTYGQVLRRLWRLSRRRATPLCRFWRPCKRRRGASQRGLRSRRTPGGRRAGGRRAKARGKTRHEAPAE